MKKICVKCKHHYMGVHLDEGMHMCDAYSDPYKTNYVTGVITGGGDAYCYKTNEGNCPSFELKK